MDQIIALALGIIASFIQGGRLKDAKPVYRYLISFGTCVVAGLVSSILPAVLDGTVDVNNVLADIGASFVASQTFYNTYFAKKNGKQP